MSRIITISIILSFVSVSIFGFVGIAFMNSHHEACIVSTAQGGKCAEESGPLGFINFHLNTLKNFSTAVFQSNSALSALLLVLVLGLTAIFELFAWGVEDRNVTIPHLRAEFSEPSSPLLMRLSHWYSLHENSPAFS